MGPELVVDDLRVRFRTRSETVDAVDGASFTVEPGAIVGLVGEGAESPSLPGRSSASSRPARSSTARSNSTVES